MKTEKEKVLKITSELIGFFFMLKIYSPHIDIITTPNETTIVIKGEYESLDYDKLRRFEVLVEESREEDVDEYYWDLAGSSSYSEFLLLGAMVDSAVVDYSEKELRIEVIRNHKK